MKEYLSFKNIEKKAMELYKFYSSSHKRLAFHTKLLSYPSKIPHFLFRTYSLKEFLESENLPQFRLSKIIDTRTLSPLSNYIFFISDKLSYFMNKSYCQLFSCFNLYKIVDRGEFYSRWVASHHIGRCDIGN